MINDAEVKSIRQNIVEAFADTPRPNLSTIHPLGCCEEHEQDFEWYRSHSCQEFKDLLPSEHFDPSEFFALHPLAYHYFVPGILLATLESINSDSEMSDWFQDSWVDNLLPDEGRIEYFKSDYLPLFTSQQRDAIVNYLRFWFDDWLTKRLVADEMAGQITYNDLGWEIHHGEVSEEDQMYLKRIQRAVNQLWPSET